MSRDSRQSKEKQRKLMKGDHFLLKCHCNATSKVIPLPFIVKYTCRHVNHDHDFNK